MSLVVRKYKKPWIHPQVPDIKYRYSVGIALCRYNRKRGKIEIVVVKKRCTYWFATFILGLYNPRDNIRVMYILSRMTPEEKLIILTLDFENMWNHMWQTHNHNPKFHKRKKISDYDYYKACKMKFEKLISDSGAKLRQMVAESRNKSLIWEIPKGRKQFIHENNIECAVREFEEETGIKKSAYILLPDIKPLKLSYRDGNTHYISTYYIAKLVRPQVLKLNFNMLDQISEIIDIKWISVDDAKLLNMSHLKFVIQIFKTAAKKIKPMDII